MRHGHRARRPEVRGPPDAWSTQARGAAHEALQLLFSLAFSQPDGQTVSAESLYARSRTDSEPACAPSSGVRRQQRTPRPPGPAGSLSGSPMQAGWGLPLRPAEGEKKDTVLERLHVVENRLLQGEESAGGQLEGPG